LLQDPNKPVNHAREIVVPLQTSSTTPSPLEAPRSITGINPEWLDAGDLTRTLA
jgi:hypothetical protein